MTMSASECPLSLHGILKRELPLSKWALLSETCLIHQTTPHLQAASCCLQPAEAVQVAL